MATAIDSIGRILTLLFLIGISAILVVTCFVVVSGILRIWLGANASANWESTEGRVISRKVNVEAARGHSIHIPVIPYSYFVNGTRYVNDRIAFDDPPNRSYSYEETQALFDEHLPGTEVTVYYNPNNPAESVLTRQHRRLLSDVLWSIVLFVVTSFFVSVFITAFREILQAKP